MSHLHKVYGKLSSYSIRFTFAPVLVNMAKYIDRITFMDRQVSKTNASHSWWCKHMVHCTSVHLALKSTVKKCRNLNTWLKTTFRKCGTYDGLCARNVCRTLALLIGPTSLSLEFCKPKGCEDWLCLTGSRSKLRTSRNFLICQNTQKKKHRLKQDSS